MSVEKKSVHVRLSPEMHQRLGVMAEFNDKDLAELASRLLERAIAGDWHDFSVLRDRLSRLGSTGNKGDL